MKSISFSRLCSSVSNLDQESCHSEQQKLFTLTPSSSHLLIAANLCFGLDFAAVEFIHSQIIEARNRGVAVLLVSEDLNELLKLSDRIVVISGGHFTYESAMPSASFANAAADFATIGQSMAGH